MKKSVVRRQVAPVLPRAAAKRNIEEEFLTELRHRRERLDHWIRLIHAEAKRESRQARSTRAAGLHRPPGD